MPHGNSILSYLISSRLLLQMGIYFVSSEPSLNLWLKTNLMVVYNCFIVIVNQISKYFIEILCIYFININCFFFLFVIITIFFSFGVLRTFSWKKLYWSWFSGDLVEFGSVSICSRKRLVAKFFITTLASLFVSDCVWSSAFSGFILSRSCVFKNSSASLCFSTC